MCEVKPGPRCTSHTRAILTKAKENYNNTLNQKNFDTLVEAQNDYDASPGGIRELKSEIEKLSGVRKIRDRRNKTGYRQEYFELTTTQELEKDMLQDRLTNGEDARKKAKVALKNMRALEKAKVEGIQTPISVPTTVLHNPDNPGSLTYGNIDVDYDSYSCSDCDNGYDEDNYGPCDEWACRGREYENIRITGVGSARSTLSTMFSTSERNIPDDLEKYGKEIGLEDKDNYTVETYSDYYGDEYAVTLNTEQKEQLQSWYYNQPNAEDREGVLSYVRSKGTETTGLTPVDALKKQLTDEKGKLPPTVTNARSSQARSLNLKDITIPAPKAKNPVNPVEPINFGTSNKVYGVVVENPQGGGFTLVDGRKRLASLPANKRISNFIVLSR